MKTSIEDSRNNLTIDKLNFNKDFTEGFKKSLPIIMGYLPVSFTFGLMASGEGLSTFIATLISLTSFTSAGQFAGTNIIVSNGTLVEIAISTLVINMRYSLMSLSLSQRVTDMPVIKKLIIAFGITDESFTVSSFESRDLNFPYLFGLCFFPYLSWAVGTLLGASASHLLPLKLQNAMGIALYGMFLALIVPEAKSSKSVLSVVIISVIISSLFKYSPLLVSISSGWAVIISTVIASTFGAIVFPKED